MRYQFVVLLTVALLVTRPAQSQNLLVESQRAMPLPRGAVSPKAGSNDLNPNWTGMTAVAGTDGWVETMVLDSAGDLYVGGGFTVAGCVEANSIARWNGHEWSSLGTGFPRGIVHALVFSGTNLYAGGGFNLAGGVPANSVAKWDGHAWSPLGSGVEGERPVVWALQLMGTNLYAGGWFTTAGGKTANCIARWDGQAWHALSTGVALGVSIDPKRFAEVRSLTEWRGDLFVGGAFTSAGGIAANNIARWDGNQWAPLSSGLTFGDSLAGVEDLAAWGTNLFVGGAFDRAGDVVAYRNARWDGHAWHQIGDGRVWAMSLTANSTNLYGFSDDARIQRWDGTGWASLSNVVGGGYSMLATDSGFFMCGDFPNIWGVGANNVARWNGVRWSAVGRGMAGGKDGPTAVLAVAKSQEKLVVGGDFSMVDGVPAEFLAVWDGTSWSKFPGGVDGPVRALAQWGDELVAAGGFTQKVARWNGQNWSAMQSPARDVWALASVSDRLFAGGEFGMVQWNGQAWTSVYSGPGQAVLALCSSEGKVYGLLSRMDGPFFKENRLARWDGSYWSTLAECPDVFHALAILDGDFYAGGEGYFPANSPYTALFRWDGTQWSSPGVVGGTVHALAFDGPELILGGTFTKVEGRVAPFLAKFDTTSRSVIAATGNGLVQIPFTGVPGKAFDVQRTDRLKVGAVWTTLNESPLTPNSAGKAAFTDLTPPSDSAYYRIRARR